MKARRSRKPLKKVDLVEPLDSLGKIVIKNHTQFNEEVTSLSANLESIQRQLIETQERVRNSWLKAEESMNKNLIAAISDASQANSTKSTTHTESTPRETEPSSDENMELARQLAGQEQALSRQKVESLAERTSKVHEALIENQNRITAAWSEFESSTASRVENQRNNGDEDV